MRGRLREDRGQATVELALVLPLLFLCAALLVHLGVALVTQLDLERMAREGARAAAVEPANATAEAHSAVSAASDRAVAVVVSMDAEFVTVEVRTEVAFVPLLGAAGARTLTADATMRREDLLNP